MGEYGSFMESLANLLEVDTKIKDNAGSIFKALDKKIVEASKQKKVLLISIDEFGKYLEYAAKNNPEKELYFIQQVAEFINDAGKNVILIASLHQDFSGYAAALTKLQRNEWEKVKGRFKEVTFNEPVEQLLLLVSEKMKEKNFLMMQKI